MNPPSAARAPLALALALALAAPQAWSAPQDETRHDQAVDLDRVVVTANPLPSTAEVLARPVEVLAGARLDEAKSNSLGETVEGLPGVQSSYFGPGVGRPIVRGLDGARVQVLSDGLASGDVSTVSVDHAVSIEPFLADQIEVLKGPATLLYGSGAIGGAVNVVDGRVPQVTTADPLEGRAELRAGTVNDERTGMFRLDGTAEAGAGNVVFHVDALHRGTGDYAIPGYAELHGAEEAADHAADPDAHEGERQGVLENSALRTDAAALGVSWIGERGFVGGAASLFNTGYGVPGHAHGEGDEGAEEEGDVRILMDQRRGELRGGLDDLGAFESLRVKLARTEYTHTEFEGDAVGTVFENASTEGRAELRHRTWGGWDGAFGLQVARRDFNAIGDEAFVPASRSRDAGLFWIGERDLYDGAAGPVKLELGARHDRLSVDVDPGEAIGPSRDFDTTSLSAALKWDASEAFHLTFGVDRAQRAPVAEELYSAGEHVATRSFEFGDPDLGVETANRAELGAHWHAGPVEVGASIYHVAFDDFIYLADTGVLEHDLPIRAWNQADARFTGAEVEVDWTMADNDTGRWRLRGFGDVVRARLAGEGTRDVTVAIEHEGEAELVDVSLPQTGDLPRIAAPRAGLELRWDRGPWRASLGATHTFEQDRTGANEEATGGYTLVDASLAWHVDTAGGNAWEVFMDGTNLLDEEARPHTSFLKDLAPRPGRGVAFGVRAFF
ncbi:TonB-dependent receptor [Luteimonas pelagia]